MERIVTYFRFSDLNILLKTIIHKQIKQAEEKHTHTYILVNISFYSYVTPLISKFKPSNYPYKNAKSI